MPYVLLSQKRESAANARVRRRDPTEMGTIEELELPGAGAGAISLADVGASAAVTSVDDGDVSGG